MIRSIVETVALLVTLAFWLPVTATTYGVYAYFAGTSCDGTPYAVYAWEDPACSEGDELACMNIDGSTSSGSDDLMNGVCSTNYVSTMRSMFSTAQYILQVTFNDSSCSVFDVAYGVPATGNCEGPFNESSTFIIGSLDANSSTSIQYFNDSQCLPDSLWWTDTTDSATLSSHSCDNNAFIWYSSADKLDASTSASSTMEQSSGSAASEGSSSSELSTEATIGIIVGCVALIIGGIAVVTFFKCRRRMKQGRQWTAMLPSDGTNSLEVAVQGQTGLWNDSVITAKRIPREKVMVNKLISHGAYGEVYNGVFNGQKVAVKMLVPSTRGNLEHVTDLLTEAKLTASMDHPHIISFIGVAWDSLSDLCVVLEFMDGGDLWTLLNKYEATKHPVGVDREKATIALHVCHALTYLHSRLR